MTRHAISTNQVSTPVGAFSPAVRCDELVYLSGHVAQDPATGKLIEGDVRAQTEQVIRNLVAVLAAAGKTLDDVIRVGIYVTDMSSFAVVNETYARHFTPPYPARTTIGVASLPLGAAVEIDLVAW